MRVLHWLRGLFARRRDEALGEAECYARLHGERDAEVRALGRVEVARIEPRPPRLLPRISGEYLRRCFEKRLDSRETASV